MQQKNNSVVTQTLDFHLHLPLQLNNVIRTLMLITKDFDIEWYRVLLKPLNLFITSFEVSLHPEAKPPHHPTDATIKPFPSNPSSAFHGITARPDWFGDNEDTRRWKRVGEHIPESLLNGRALSCCSPCGGFFLFFFLSFSAAPLKHLSFESAWVCASVYTHARSVDRRTVRPHPLHLHRTGKKDKLKLFQESF